MIISNNNRNKWGTAEFWQKLCPGLTIGENAATVAASSRGVQPGEAELCRQRLIDDGYATIDESLAGSSIIGKLLEGIKTLQGVTSKEEEPVKFPASFILLFDETWELARIARNTLKQSTHTSNDFNYDILAWYIEAGGFSPHRDRQPEHVLSSFHEDDMQAKFVTNWIALSNAQPENSCLYVIPKSRDPGYLKGDDGPDAVDPMRRALPTKADFQHIRAIPRTPGQSLLFTHRIIHWGSQRDKTSKLPPRVAISFVCSDPSYEKPYIDPKYFTNTVTPPFHIRLLLVCAQLLIYYQRFDLPKESIKAYYDYCKGYENELEKSYRQKVYLEFVNAMKEAKKEAVSEGKILSTNIIGDGILETPVGKDDDNEDDEEDAMMEEMLNAEEQGYGEFEDDYEDTIENTDDDNDLQLADGNEDDSGDDAEGLSLFGNPDSKEPDPKRKKVNVG